MSETKPISPEDLERLDALLQRAAVDEIEALGEDLAKGAGETFELNTVGIETAISACAYVVAFRNDLPALRARIAELEREVRRYEQAAWDEATEHEEPFEGYKP